MYTGRLSGRLDVATQAKKALNPKPQTASALARPGPAPGTGATVAAGMCGAQRVMPSGRFPNASPRPRKA